MSAPFGPTVFADAEPVNPAISAYLGKVALAAAAPPKRRVLHIDYETYSTVDLRKAGASRYARDPSTRILMLAYGWDEKNIRQWVPDPSLRGRALIDSMPADLRLAFLDPSVTLAAWNAPFEMAITEHTLGLDIPISRWMDVMVLAYSLSLPGKLEKCGEVIGLSEERRKMARGKLLVRKFCQPRKPTKNKPWMVSTSETDPEEWQEFLDYNRRDVVAEIAIYKRLRKYQMPDHEWALWHLDQKINNAGIPINLRAVRAAVRLTAATTRKDLREMQALTGLANPNSGPQLLPWLREHGYVYLDLKKGHIERAAKAVRQEIAEIEAGTEGWPAWMRRYALGTLPKLLRVLELRARVAKTSVKKYPALLDATDEDGNLRGCHQFAGAGRTWRWSGRRFQPQNLAKPSKAMEKFVVSMAPTHDENGNALSATERAKIGFGILVHDIEHLTVAEFWAKYDHPTNPEINTMEALVAAVRPMVQAAPGHVLVDADLSAIENVVLGWLADDNKILRVFRLGLDPYIDFAVDMFGMPYAQIEAEVEAGDKTKRTTAKPGVLGCLRGDTPVLTHRGWVRLVEVAHGDRLWDGVEWVPHGGVAFRGRQPVQEIGGVWATPDHKFLTEEGWRTTCLLVSQPMTFESALATANGSFSRMPGVAGRAGSGISADAAAGSSAPSPGQTSSEVSAPNAQDALLRTVAPRSERQSARRYSTYSQIASTLLGDGVRIPRIVPTSITEAGAFVCGSQTATSGSITSSTTSGPTAALRSTAPTTTETMRWETCDWRPAPSRTQISDTWDVVDAGPRSRFTILTESGPLIAHNCGYMLGAGHAKENPQTGEIEGTGLLGYAWGMGVDLTPEMAALSVETFRAKFKKVKKFWYDLDEACREVIKTGQARTVRYLDIDMKGPFMRIRLPSGRFLHYLRPELQRKKMPWKDANGNAVYKDQITYENLENGAWRRVTTHPGKLTENVTQAVARDILAHGMTLADRAGLALRLHVHDQAVAMMPVRAGARALETLIRCLTTLPAWANAKMPLKAAGFTSPIFLKD